MYFNIYTALMPSLLDIHLLCDQLNVEVRGHLYATQRVKPSSKIAFFHKRVCPKDTPKKDNNYLNLKLIFRHSRSKYFLYAAEVKTDKTSVVWWLLSIVDRVALLLMLQLQQHSFERFSTKTLHDLAPRPPSSRTFDQCLARPASSQTLNPGWNFVLI